MWVVDAICLDQDWNRGQIMTGKLLVPTRIATHCKNKVS